MLEFYYLSVIFTIPVALIFCDENIEKFNLRKREVYLSAVFIAFLPIINLIYLLAFYEVIRKWVSSK